MNPYGITQVDVPGILGVYESAKSNRLRDMQVKRQWDREDRDEERRIKREGIMARIYQPKGGDPASTAPSPSGGGFEARMNQDPGAPAQLVSPAQLPPRTDGLRINPQALEELYAFDPEEAMKVQTAVYNFDKTRLDALRKNGEQIQAVAYHLSQMPPEQRQAELQAALPVLREMGIDPEALTNADLSDAGLQRYMNFGRSIKDLITEDQARYQVIPEGGTLVNTRDPEALRRFQGGQVPSSSGPARPQSRADYEALPPGSQYIAPDGTVRTKGGAPSQGGGGFLPGQ